MIIFFFFLVLRMEKNDNEMNINSYETNLDMMGNNHEDEYDEVPYESIDLDNEVMKISEIHQEMERQYMQASGTPGAGNTSFDEKSIYIGQVDYEATPEELQEHFQGCGIINRITILCDKLGQPKGYAYVEFQDKEATENALRLHDSVFKGRKLKVSLKRNNIPGLKYLRESAGRGRVRGRGRGMSSFGRGRGYRGRGRGYRGNYRGGFRGFYQGYSPF